MQPLVPFPDLREVALGTRPADVVFTGGRVLNVFTGELVDADVALVGNTIAGVGAYEGDTTVDCTGLVIAPGLIDAHMHIESTLVRPGELAPALLARGTTTAVADAHEIVNVCGASGLAFVLDETDDVVLDFFCMLPSSVPATLFETNGADFTAADMKAFLDHPRVLGLGEVMGYPDVLAGEPAVLEKLALCADRIIDGHAPGVTGAMLQTYAASGVMTDHESSSWAEALEKLRAGFTVLAREGSAARNVSAIVTGLVATGTSSEHLAFCTDDKHFADIVSEGHIDFAVRTAIEAGLTPVEALICATHHAAVAYGLRDRGALAPGRRADLLLLDDLASVQVGAVFKEGRLVAGSLPRPGASGTAERGPGESDRAAGTNAGTCRGADLLASSVDPRLLDTVRFTDLDAAALRLPTHDTDHVIEVIPGELLTRHLIEPLPSASGVFCPRDGYDKLVVVERHRGTGGVAVAALKGYGLRGAAIATTVAHDSHNVLAAGDNDDDLVLAMHRVRELGGGYVLVAGGQVVAEVPLPIAGLLSPASGVEVHEQLEALRERAREHGVPGGIDPAITLSFLALPVIPEIRLTDRGLFDVVAFAPLTA